MKLIEHRKHGAVPRMKLARLLHGLVSTLPLLAVLVAANARAQSYPLYTPVHIGTANEIKDEWGNTLNGSAVLATSKRDLVQILWASNSVIHAPAYDGTPNPANPLVAGGTVSIGHLVSPALLSPGLFSATLANPRPPQNSRIFVRVFNAATVEDASFYADSQLLQVFNNNVLMVDITATTTPIDPRDNDGDGLNNSWEKSVSSDPENWDTDGDGVRDGDEFRAGTDLLDENSLFVAVELASDVNGDAVLTWDAVPGKRYQVEHMSSMDAIPLTYSNVNAVITAGEGATAQTTITNGFISTSGKYRVRLVE